MIIKINTFLHKKVSIAPLVTLRILFGGLLFYSVIRNFQKNWIVELYVNPTYHFSFFSWIKPLDYTGIYTIYLLLGISSFCIIIGAFYRLNTFLFFILFAYVELIDKTYYLNHYYLVSLLTFWLMLVPANRKFSVDVLLFPKIKNNYCHNWQILIFKVQLSIVYFYAGLAKVNPDWLFQAQPMATWLPGKYQIPILGKWLHLKEIAFLFSWLGCLYDLFIWIFLIIKRTRVLAYIAVVVFHILTAILFPRIGMFPFIMITSTIIFFSAKWHEKILALFSKPNHGFLENSSGILINRWSSVMSVFLICYFIVQLYLPLRYLQYPGNLFWHEKGYRFSWRVMLMEKNGATSFILKDPVKNSQYEVNQNDYLTPFQKQQMKSQPDMILQFAHHIGDEFLNQNGYEPEVYVKSRISLNGRRSQDFTNDTINVYSQSSAYENDFITSIK